MNPSATINGDLPITPTPWPLPAEYEPTDPPDSRLKLMLTLETNQLRADDPIPCTITLQNQSDEPLLVQSRLSVNKPFLVGAVGEVGFVILDSSGTMVGLPLYISPRNLRSEDFHLLNPGDHVESSFDLSDVYALEPDTYTIYTLYSNIFDAFDGRPAWKGTLIAAPVTLTVEP